MAAGIAGAGAAGEAGGGDAAGCGVAAARGAGAGAGATEQPCGRVIVVLGPFDGPTPSPQTPSACGVSVSEVTVVAIVKDPENDQLFAVLNTPFAIGCAPPDVSMSATFALLRELSRTSAVTV